MATVLNTPDLSSYGDALINLASQNNMWSAEQAQKQMDFQERMSNTSHQREMADLKAAGLNPVLSAQSGATSPSGAMGTFDSGITNAFGNIITKMLDIQSDNAKANLVAQESNKSSYSSGSGYFSSSARSTEEESKDPVKVAAQGISDYVASGAKGIWNAVTGFVNGLVGKDKGKYDNTATYAAGKQINNSYESSYENTKNINVVNRKTGEKTPLSSTPIKQKISAAITTLQKAITGSSRALH